MTDHPHIKNELPETSDADFLFGAASAGDCTGLIPAPPRNGEEWRSYLQIRSLMTARPPAQD